jgi:FAD dependent oxidoreductase TIGR03364
MKVAVFERNARPVGASIRNFGMIWPVGQPPGEIREIALESRKHWLDVLISGRIWHRKCGSLHLAYEEDEMAVLEEFVEKGVDLGYKASIVTAVQAKEKSPPIKTTRLLGAMWNPEELCVYARDAMVKIPELLAHNLRVAFHWNSPVTQIDEGSLVASSKTYVANRIIVCPGDDIKTLFPDLLQQEAMRRCKLQMLRLKPKNPALHIETHLCAGLSLDHFPNFQICDKLPQLTERLARTMPEYVRLGIHLLVSQHGDGGLTVGESQEYPDEIDPFLSPYIEKLTLKYLDTFLPLDQMEVVERWHNVYAKHDEKPYALLKPSSNVAVLAGLGPNAMTLSFGLTSRVLKEMGWLEPTQTPTMAVVETEAAPAGANA